MDFKVKKYSKKRDGFYFYTFKTFNGNETVEEEAIVLDQITSKHIEYIIDYNIDKIIVEEGLVKVSINNLIRIPKIEYLWIRGNFGPNYSFLSQINGLKILQIEEKKHVELENIEGLETLNVTASNIILNKELPSLKVLYVSGEVIKSILPGFLSTNINDLHFLNKCKNLNTLIIRFTNIKTFNCIEKLNSLVNLVCLYNQKLINIEALDGVKHTLKTLNVGKCNKIENYDIISEMENLEQLFLYKMRKIPSIKFIYNLGNLNYIDIKHSSIIDRDMTPILNISHKSIKPLKKSYFKQVNGIKVKLTKDDFIGKKGL